jgi:hypothetical protein
MTDSLFGAFADSSINTFVGDLVKFSLEYSRETRSCPKFSDYNFILTNIVRTLQEQKTGRSFLQSADEVFNHPCEVSVYFDALHSTRRLEMLREVHDAFLKKANQHAYEEDIDYLADFPELKGRLVYASDGHYHEHASHAQRTLSGKHVPAGTIYLFDLHSGMLSPLAIVQNQKKHHHEIKPLRKALRQLNQGQHKEKPIIIYDLAIQDKGFMTDNKLNRNGGVDIITLLKSNIKLLFKEPTPFDVSKKINTGIVGDYMVGLDNACNLRMIHYINPEDGEEYKFLTTLDDFEPGLIAWL